MKMKRKGLDSHGVGVVSVYEEDDPMLV